jgi:geranylgeranyl diphosphate synthase type I
MHSDNGWNGDSAAFGRTAAILLGDLLLGWSDELFSDTALPTDRVNEGRAVFDRMRTEVGGGQYLDTLEQVRGGHNHGNQAERALRVIRYKAARYSVEHPLVLGGTLARASESVLAGYSAYGSALGEAFQLRDDILGVFGDPAVTGKPAGDDLREGKRTVLIAYALEKANRPQTATIEGFLGDPELDDDGVAAVREAIVASGALERVENRVTQLVDEAQDALARLDVTEEGRSALSALVGIASSRAS